MIACKRHHLEQRAAQRGYTLDEVMPCVVSQDGDQWTVDTEHAAYPAKPKPGFTPEPPPELAPTHGPGTELKKLLAKVGITASPDCSCNARARLMDERGVEWCEQNLDEIVGWLREEATKRKLPFVDVAGRVLVRRAIANARKAANAERPSLSAGGQALALAIHAAAWLGHRVDVSKRPEEPERQRTDPD